MVTHSSVPALESHEERSLVGSEADPTEQMSRAQRHLGSLTGQVDQLKVMERTKKQDPTVYCVGDIHLKYRDTHRLKVSEWRKIKQAETPGKNAGVAVLIPHNADLRARKVTQIKRDIYHDKGSVLQDDATILNVSTHSIKICEAQTDRTTRRNRWTHYRMWDITTFYQKWTDPAGRKSVGTQSISVAPSVNWIQLMPIDYFVQQLHSTFSAQGHVEHSLG